MHSIARMNLTSKYPNYKFDHGGRWKELHTTAVSRWADGGVHAWASGDAEDIRFKSKS